MGSSVVEVPRVPPRVPRIARFPGASLLVSQISTLTLAVNVLTPLERLSLLISALCHDLDHDGHSNSFHVNSGSE